MHRLLKIQVLPLSKYSRESFSLLNFTANSCLLCKRNSSSIGSFRQNSTIVNPSLKPKKYKRKKKDYAELLIVTNNSSHQRRANVKKLSFNDLELLATTNLNLSELHKLKEISNNNVVLGEHTYYNLNVIDSLPSSSENTFKANTSYDQSRVVSIEVPDMNVVSEMQNVSESYTLPVEEIHFQQDLQQIVEQENEFDSLKIVNSLQPELVDDQIAEIDEIKDPPTKPLKPDLDHKRREEIITKTLAAYVEVCAHLRNPQRGLSALNFHRYKTKRLNNKMYIPIKSTNVYNALLNGFAQKGSLYKVKEILDVMKEEGVECNVQTYVAIFQCLAATDENEDELAKYTKKALAQNITFDDIMNDGLFLNNFFIYLFIYLFIGSSYKHCTRTVITCKS